MRFTHSDESTIIIKYVTIFGLIVPVYSIDTIWTLVAVVNTFLITQHLFAIENEWDALTGKDGSLSKFVKGNYFSFTGVRSCSMKSIHQTHIVVAADVSYHLCRFFCPTIDGSMNTKLNVLLMSSFTDEECTLFVAPEWTTQGITKFVAEGSYTWNV